MTLELRFSTPHHSLQQYQQNIAIIWALQSQRYQINTGAYEGMLIMFTPIMIPPPPYDESNISWLHILPASGSIPSYKI